MNQEFEVEDVLDIEPSIENPRNSEGSIIELGDGSLMLAYSRFLGGSTDDALTLGRAARGKVSAPCTTCRRLLCLPMITRIGCTMHFNQSWTKSLPP